MVNTAITLNTVQMLKTKPEKGNVGTKADAMSEMEIFNKSNSISKEDMSYLSKLEEKDLPLFAELLAKNGLGFVVKNRVDENVTRLYRALSADTSDIGIAPGAILHYGIFNLGKQISNNLEWNYFAKEGYSRKLNGSAPSDKIPEKNDITNESSQYIKKSGRKTKSLFINRPNADEKATGSTDIALGYLVVDHEKFSTYLKNGIKKGHSVFDYDGIDLKKITVLKQYASLLDNKLWTSNENGKINFEQHIKVAHALSFFKNNPTNKLQTKEEKEMAASSKQMAQATLREIFDLNNDGAVNGRDAYAIRLAWAKVPETDQGKNSMQLNDEFMKFGIQVEETEVGSLPKYVYQGKPLADFAAARDLAQKLAEEAQNNKTTLDVNKDGNIDENDVMLLGELVKSNLVIMGLTDNHEKNVKSLMGIGTNRTLEYEQKRVDSY